MHRLGKAAGSKGSREFKSRRLRQQYFLSTYAKASCSYRHVQISRVKYFIQWYDSFSPQQGFYDRLRIVRGDDDGLASCIEQTVSKLAAQDTSSKRPGILLGKIQSGKTRAFIGVIALAFDQGYDIAIILTKGTKALRPVQLDPF